MSLTRSGDIFPRLWLFHLFSHFVAGTCGPSGPLLNSTPHSGNTLCNNTVCQTPLSVQHLTSRCAHIIVFRPLNSCLPLRHEKWRSSHPLSCPTTPHPPPRCCHSTLCHIDKTFFVLSCNIHLPAVVQVEIRAARTDCSLPLSLSLFFFPRKSSTGEGPREGELEDLHEDEPSWVLSRRQSFVFVLFSPTIFALNPFSPSTHFLSNLWNTIGVPFQHTGETQHFKSGKSLVLAFRLVYAQASFFSPQFPTRCPSPMWSLRAPSFGRHSSWPLNHLLFCLASVDR